MKTVARDTFLLGRRGGGLPESRPEAEQQFGCWIWKAKYKATDDEIYEIRHFTYLLTS